MAKKKKPTRKKVQPEPKVHSAFWPMAGSVVLMVAALLVLLGGFGTGGVLPKDLFHGAYWALGWMAFLLPVALVYLGVYKFKSEEHEIPLPNFMSMLALLVLAASGLDTSFATKN